MIYTANRIDVGRYLVYQAFPLRLRLTGRRAWARDVREKRTRLTVTSIDRDAGVITVRAS